MNEEQKLQALLRLKRHETPPEGYFEQFLKDFQERQRKEILQRGSLSLLWERIQTWMEGLRRPAVAWSLAGAYAAVMVLILAWPRPTRSTSTSVHASVLVWQGDPQNRPKAQPAPPRNRDEILVSHPKEIPQQGKQRNVNPDGTAPIIGPSQAVPKPVEDPPVKPPVGNLREL